MVLFPSHIDTVISKQQIENEYLRVPKFALRSLGFWPHDNFFTWKVLPVAIASFTIISLGVIVELCFGYTHINNLPLALDAVCPALTKGVTVIKFVVLYRSRNEIAKMLDELKLKWMNDKVPECSYFNLKATRIAWVFAMIMLVFANSASVGYSLRPIIMMLRQYFSGDEVIRTLPFKSEYPYDEFGDPAYEITYILISLTGTICVFGLVGSDGIFIALCLHVAAQFQIIQHDFAQLTPKEKNAHHEKMIQYSIFENQVLNKKLKELIRRHQDTIKMCDHMVQLFSINIFSHFVSASLVLCCVSVNLLLFILAPTLTIRENSSSPYIGHDGFSCGAKDAEAIVYFSYGTAAMTQLLVFCAGGTYLEDASYNIHRSAYFTDWYKLDIRNQRLILLIILRAQRPSKILVPFFEASLQSFTSIVRAAGSYIALFRTFL